MKSAGFSQILRPRKQLESGSDSADGKTTAAIAAIVAGKGGAGRLAIVPLRPGDAKLLTLHAPQATVLLALGLPRDDVFARIERVLQRLA